MPLSKTSFISVRTNARGTMYAFKANVANGRVSSSVRLGWTAVRTGSAE